MRSIFIPAILILFLVVPVRAQPADSRALTASDKAELVEDLGITLQDHYVYRERVAEMSSEIQRRSQGASYRETDDPEDFATLLSADLVEISGDSHFSVFYDPEWAAHTAEQRALGNNVGFRVDELDALQQENFGFKNLKILEGNVGYVRFDLFADPEHSYQAAANAMAFVEHTDAVIFDMRYNRGGHNAVGQFLSSFLFAADSLTKLLDYSYTADGELRHGAFWTTAAVPGRHRPQIPVYILTSTVTFSAGEWFAYSLQKLNRATIVGRQTAGASHAVTRTPIDESFFLQVPVGRLSSPVDDTDFEGVGVAPDHDVPSQIALDYAHKLALETLSERSEETRAELDWLLPVLSARLDSARLDRQPASVASRVAQFEGHYDGRDIRVVDGRLTYHWRGRHSLGLTSLGGNLFAIEGVTDFRFLFVEESGRVTALERINKDGTRTSYLKK